MASKKRLAAFRLKAAQEAARGKPPPNPDDPFGRPEHNPFQNTHNRLKAVRGYQYPSSDESIFLIKSVMELTGADKWVPLKNLLGVPHLNTISRWMSGKSRPSPLYLTRFGLLLAAKMKGFPVGDIDAIDWNALPISIVWKPDSEYAEGLAGRYSRGVPGGAAAATRNALGQVVSSGEDIKPLAAHISPCPECGGDVAGSAARGEWECVGCAAWFCAGECLDGHVHDCVDYIAVTTGDYGGEAVKASPPHKHHPPPPVSNVSYARQC